MFAFYGFLFKSDSEQMKGMYNTSAWRERQAHLPPWKTTGPLAEARIWGKGGSKLGGKELSAFVPLSDPVKCISVGIFSSEEPPAQDKDFHMVVQIRTPLQRCLKRANNLGKCLEAAQRKGSSLRGRRQNVFGWKSRLCWLMMLFYKHWLLWAMVTGNRGLSSCPGGNTELG